MALILKDFATLEADLAFCGLGSNSCQHLNFGAARHGEHTERADGIVEFIGYLQHPFHATKSKRGAGGPP